MALLDEIQRLVPGYDVSRTNLAAGNDVHTGIPAEVERSAGDSISPANDSLFTSGTLGRYSRILNSVMERRKKEPAEKPAAAD